MLGLELVFCAFCRYPQNQNSCNQTFQIGEYTSRAYATEPLESGNEFEFADAWPLVEELLLRIPLFLLWH